MLEWPPRRCRTPQQKREQQRQQSDKTGMSVMITGLAAGAVDSDALADAKWGKCQGEIAQFAFVVLSGASCKWV